MNCPKCGYETSKEACPSCGVNFAKIHLKEKWHLALPRPSRCTKPLALDVLTIKILWVSNLLYFGLHCIGASGEGEMFVVIFYGFIAFPSSLLVFLFSAILNHLINFVGLVVTGGSLPAVMNNIVLFLLMLLIGYFQWFVLVPRLATAIRRYINDISEKSPRKSRWLLKGVNNTRIILRWGGFGCFIVLSLNYINELDNFRAFPILLLFLSGAIVSILVFRPRSSQRGLSLKRELPNKNVKAQQGS